MIAAWELAPPPTDTAPASPAVGQLDQVGRVDLAADQDERSRGGRGRGVPAQVIDHGRGHLADVARPLGQVGVGQGGEHGGLSLGGRR